MSKPGPTQSDKFQKKLREVKKRTRELEDENERLVVKVSRGRRSLLRLKAERRFLLERLEEFERLQESDDLESGWGESSVTGNDEVEKVLSHKKPEKQPNTPKRPTNAFLMYCSLQRARDGDKLKDVALSEQTRILGNDWKSLSPDEKKIYYDMYEKDKQRYSKEMTIFNQANLKEEASGDDRKHDEHLDTEEEIEPKPQPPKKSRSKPKPKTQLLQSLTPSHQDSSQAISQNESSPLPSQSQPESQSLSSAQIQPQYQKILQTQGPLSLPSIQAHLQSQLKPTQNHALPSYNLLQPYQSQSYQSSEPEEMDQDDNIEEQDEDEEDEEDDEEEND